jgi:hypothetical protein
MILRPYPRRTQVPIGAALIGAAVVGAAVIAGDPVAAQAASGAASGAADRFYERSFVLAYSENEVQGSFELPKLITVTCPAFSGTKHLQHIQFELVIKRPKNADEKMKFSLVPHGKSSNMILREAAIHIAEEEFIKCVQAALRIPAEQILPALYIRDSKIHSYSSNLNFVVVR